MSILQSGATKSLAASYDIDNSLRFNAGDSSKLSRTPSTAGDRKTWTMSCWVKVSGKDNGFVLMDAGSNPNYLVVYMYQGTIRLYDPSGGSDKIYITSTRVLRDPSSWYHIVIQLDTTQSTNTDRVKIYVNNERVTEFNNTTWPTEDYESFINSAVEHTINDTGGTYSECYMAEYYFIDGTALTPTSFAETSSTTNQWIPLDSDDVKDAVTFGTNGFYQKYGGTELAASFSDSALHQPHTVTANGDVHTDTSIKKIGTASAQFDGTDDYLSVPYSTDFDFNTDDFTLETWVYLNNVSTNQQLIATGNTSWDSVLSWTLDVNASTAKLRFHMNNASTTAFNLLGNTALSASTWYHIAMVRSGDTGTLYIDGTADATTDMSGWTSFVLATDNYPLMGHSGFGGDLDGYLDEIRISKGIARYVGAFTPSTTAFTSDQYTKLLLHCDGADDGTTFTDSADSAPRHTITANGDVTNTRAIRKIGDSSIAFDTGGDDYLSIPASSDWAFGTDPVTIELWFYLDSTGRQYFFGPGTDTSTHYYGIGLDYNSVSTNKLGLWVSSDGSSWDVIDADSGGNGIGSTTITQDAWHHVAVVRDGDDWDLYLDGTADITTVTDTASVATGAATIFNIGRSGYTGGAFYNSGYMDEFRISDTARYTGTFTPSTTAFTADSNTKLLIHSNWDGGLGADSSGNSNDFVVTNLVATDQVVDSPTNNFATLNPLVQSYADPTYSEGNLQVSGNNSSLGTAGATMSVLGGKWYWEVYNKTINSASWNDSRIGIKSDTAMTNSSVNPQDHTGTFWYGAIDGDKRIDGVETSYGASYTNGDIVGVALDLESGPQTIEFYKNNVSQGSLSLSGGVSTAASIVPVTVPIYSADSQLFNFGQDSSFAGNVTAQGNQDSNDKGDFYYEPPTDYLALCTDNLSDPDIKLPGENFTTHLFTGNDTASNAQSIGLQPDLVWLKERDGTAFHGLFDSVRGRASGISSNDTMAASTSPAGDDLASFDSNGFTVGEVDSWNSTNKSGALIASWNWKAGGAPTADNSAGAGAVPTAGSVKIDGSNLGSALAGTIAATRLSANTTAGFSIASYTGTGSTATIGHGLSQAPELLIVKNRDEADGWAVGASYIYDGVTNWLYYMTLNTTAERNGSDQFWNSTVPSASVFTVEDASSVNASTEKYIAYCFHSVEGYSKVGTAIGTAGNLFVYMGFKPAFVMWKAINSAQNWNIYDNKRPEYNVSYHLLEPNTTDAESGDWTTNRVDIVSNGFNILSTGLNQLNGGSGYTYFYYAIAESPFKYSNAR